MSLNRIHAMEKEMNFSEIVHDLYDLIDFLTVPFHIENNYIKFRYCKFINVNLTKQKINKINKKKRRRNG